MDAQNKRKETKRSTAWLSRILALCVLCIAMNIIGAKLALALNLPVFLDSAGTMLAGVIGGYVPAIIVGYLTNLIISISDSATMYYSIISVLIALAAAFFAKRGWFNDLPHILLSVPVFALIGGGLGSILTFFLYGAGFGEGMSAQFAHYIYDNGFQDVFCAQLCADLFVDFIDKSLTVLFVALIYHLLSEDFLAKLDFRPWQQAPMSQTELDETMNVDSRVMSLQNKFIIVVVSLVLIVATSATTISFNLFHQEMVSKQSDTATNIASYLEQSIDADRIDEYMRDGEEAPWYRETERQLAKTRDLFPGVQDVRVCQFKDDGCHIVFDPDADSQAGSKPGDVIPLDPALEPYKQSLVAGEAIDPVMTSGENGWLLSVYQPIKNSRGETACYLEINLSMSQVVSNEQIFLTSVIALFAAFFVLVCAIVLWSARYNIFIPVNSMARASSNFTLGDESTRNESATKIDALNIRTGDEIENAFNAINKMSQETVRYTADTQEKSATIERMQENLIMVMADLVESRDKSTGDHVKNTAAYTRIIMNQMRREGVYPDVLTNEFISNVVKSAPLHDVGKISISDTILNKPGGFTDEEYEIMKHHTIAGKEILERAKGAFSEPSYLDEGKRLAAFHHEKWNGTGYPYGLEGEQIPLSARIMAVADVFDALVAKRSYKEGFPVDKALAIIEEGIGTHFDPQVARALLHAQDKARAIVEESNARIRAEEEQAKAKKQAEETEQAEEEQE